MMKNTKSAGLKLDPAKFGAKADTPVAPENLERAPSTTTKPLQIKISIEKHREIKAYAAEQDMSITELIMKAYEEYRTRHM